MTSDISVKKFMEQILFKFGRIDILVNNAGYPFDRNIWYKRFHEVTDEELQKIMEVDLKGLIRLSKAVIPSMLKNDLNKNGGGGVIINISSTPAIAGHTRGCSVHYCKICKHSIDKMYCNGIWQRKHQRLTHWLLETFQLWQHIIQ